MGLEQKGQSYNPDLASSKDLLDLRLPRALKAWSGFKDAHQDQIASVGVLQPAEVSLLSKDLSIAISGAIGMAPLRIDLPHTNPGRIVQLKGELAGEGSKAIFMRHGEQSPPEWIHTIDDPRIKKIRMMQNPFNQDDLLTNRGLVQVFVTAFGLLHITAATGKNLTVLSSENRRAKEVAEVITTVVPNATLQIEEGLSSITYKDERDEPPATVEAILEDMPLGSMPLDSALIDKWCKPGRDGRSQSAVINQTMTDLLTRGTQKGGNELLVVLTHSQQLAEVLRLAGKLQDPNMRVPELSMFVAKSQTEITAIPKGLVADEVVPDAKNMRKVLEKVGAGYEWYKIRREEYKTTQKIPFLVAPKPLYLPKAEASEITNIGRDIVDFISVAHELYSQEEDVKQLLDWGKPDGFKGGDPKYLFVRPDLIATEGGFSVCEVETSPFGLALAELLNRGYRAAGFETMVGGGVLSDFVRENTPDKGTIVYSGKTSSYEGQLRFLAKEVFGGIDRDWVAKEASVAMDEAKKPIYRAFYTYEPLEDMFVQSLISNLSAEGTDRITPTLTPHMEEKALLSLIWDKRWEEFLMGQLGKASFDHLRQVVPPTWVVGQERFFAPGLPGGIESTEGLGGISQSKRNFVLKKSGFGSGSSWGEGVVFLQEKSARGAKQALATAVTDEQSLYVVQEFRKPLERNVPYSKDADTAVDMKARLRITPYFAMVGSKIGELVAIKATGCENTNYIHASTGSINTAVATGNLK